MSVEVLQVEHKIEEVKPKLEMESAAEALAEPAGSPQAQPKPDDGKQEAAARATPDDSSVQPHDSNADEEKEKKDEKPAKPRPRKKKGDRMVAPGGVLLKVKSEERRLVVVERGANVVEISCDLKEVAGEVWEDSLLLTVSNAHRGPDKKAADVVLLSARVVGTQLRAPHTLAISQETRDESGNLHPFPVEIESGEVVSVPMKFRFPRQTGTYRIPMVMELAEKELKDEFHSCVSSPVLSASEEGLADQSINISLTRTLEFHMGDSLTKRLAPKSPYRVSEWQNRRALIRPPGTRGRILPAPPLPDDGRNQLRDQCLLAPFSVPLKLRLLAAHNFRQYDGIPPPLSQELDRIQKLLQDPLAPENHAAKLQLMVHLEELQLEVDTRNYDLNGVRLKRTGGRLFELAVPGLAEHRPSLLRGDMLYLRCQDQQDPCEYQGVIHEVRLETVWVGFSPEFDKKFRPKADYAVRFTFCRVPLKMMQRALQLTSGDTFRPLLFPTKTDKDPAPETKLEFFDEKVAENPEQQAAVRNILAGSFHPAPYIIFGPPGTGKTVTIAEAIKQVLKLDPRSRVLACAPSNASADLLCLRLLRHVEPHRILRLNAISRSMSSVREEVLECSNVYCGSPSGFFYPPKDDFHMFRVVICTLISAGRLVSAKFKPGFFSHIFVDESGQATEPEMLVPLSGLLAPKATRPGTVVLAGDPQQLGPVLRSITATQYGLGLSFMERLMECEPYRRLESGDFDGRFLTKLVRNYRSHPEILKIPSQLFYQNELVPCSERSRVDALSTWEELPAKGVPMLFHGVVGADVREERSPSFFNPAEAAMVQYYVDRLIDSAGVRDADIGVIAPYRKQVQKMRELLRVNLKKYGQISVGSVEEFQGAERRVIIISTVRSDSEFLAMDTEFKLGFLRNPKRFNTAITRAKSLLILIGNPWILERDEYWKTLLKFCLERGAYRGMDYQLGAKYENGGGDAQNTILFNPSDMERVSEMRNLELQSTSDSAPATVASA